MEEYLSVVFILQYPPPFNMGFIFPYLLYNYMEDEIRSFSINFLVMNASKSFLFLKMKNNKLFDLE